MLHVLLLSESSVIAHLEILNQSIMLFELRTDEIYDVNLQLTHSNAFRYIHVNTVFGSTASSFG